MQSTFPVRVEISAALVTDLHRRLIWRVLTSNAKMSAGSLLVAVFMLIAIFGPWIAPYDPNAFSPLVLRSPSVAHWLGTTSTGQDVFSQLLVGARSSLFAGIATGLLVTVISVGVGCVGGYMGGMVDELLSLLSNIFLVLPAFPLVLVLAAYVPVKSTLSVSLMLTLTSWAWGARVMRAQTLSLRHREFVAAASMSGESTWRIIFCELLPNEIGIVVAGFVGTVLSVILAEAGLEFLGLGDVNVVSWGSMFYWVQNDDAIVQGAWWWFLPPGICMALLGAGLAFLNVGIAEMARDGRPSPRAHRRKKSKEA